MQFDCELLHATSNRAVVIYRMPAAYQLEDILLPEGTRSLGYFWQDKPYNVYHWIDENLDTLALYFNICDNTKIDEHTIEWRDLAVDVLITPDQRCRILDEDELPENLDPDLRSYIETTQKSLSKAPLSRLAEYDKLTREFITAI